MKSREAVDGEKKEACFGEGSTVIYGRKQRGGEQQSRSRTRESGQRGRGELLPHIIIIISGTVYGCTRGRENRRASMKPNGFRGKKVRSSGPTANLSYPLRSQIAYLGGGTCLGALSSR